MNRAIIVGRMTRDPEVRYTQGDNLMAIARFTVAVDRRIKKDGEQTADFISCVAFGKTAEFIERFFNKGRRIGLVGHIQTGSYDNKDGQKVYTTDVIVDECEFVDSAPQNNATEQKQEDFSNLSNSSDLEELPFN